MIGFDARSRDPWDLVIWDKVGPSQAISPQRPQPELTFTKMNRLNESPLYSYSWHQSHDQATVLLLVPYSAQEEDVEVVIESNQLVAGVRGQPPILKGRLYGTVDTDNSLWQLEPRNSQSRSRMRTISTTSSASTPSSYAFVSDPEISSSFAASIEGGQVSDAEEFILPSSGFPSPSSTPLEVFTSNHRRHASHTSSRAVSPGRVPRSLVSSFSSLESLHSPTSGRLLTLHLEKEQPVIWPSLIVGPVSEALSPSVPNTLPYPSQTEERYNMDPTSLVLIALEFYDIRKDKETAFEYFLRAWHRARAPVATMRLVSHYVPISVSFDLPPILEPLPGTTDHYIQCLGGPWGLAQLYLDAGLLHLEGATSVLLSSSVTLSSIRMPSQSPSENSTEAWRRDRDAASKYFERARALHPDLDVPLLPLEADSATQHQTRPARIELEMPSIDFHTERQAEPSLRSGSSRQGGNPNTIVRRRRKKEEGVKMVNEPKVDAVDNAWYLYIPGLVGAGTAILVVGVVGALSLSNWRKGQGS